MSSWKSYGSIQIPLNEKAVVDVLSKSKYAFSAAVALKIILVPAVFLYFYFHTSTSVLLTSTQDYLNASVADNNCDNCPEFVTRPNCTDSGYPVLGGLDFVQYFSFDNESQIGEIGNSEFASEYLGYTYYFIDYYNKELFDNDPEKYIPQFGGFCSWGVAGEYCPQFYWSGTCLGPSSNWGLWSIYDDKLYFFYLLTAKELFLQDSEYYAAAGAARWSEWYNGSTAVSNTRCYFSDPSGFTDVGHNHSALPPGAPTRTGDVT